MTNAPQSKTAAAGETPRRLFVFNGGFLTQKRVRRILELSGYEIRLGAPGPDGMIGVWGQSPTSPRGEKVSAKTGAPILRVEDAFLRSVLPGRDGPPPLGLHLDTRGVHFDPSTPSDLERLLADHPLDDTALLARAKDAITRIRRGHLSKYTCFDPKAALPRPGYVLLIDQTNGDASVTASGATRNTFLEMLFCAREEHPNTPIMIKSHPETTRGHRDGHFREEDLDHNTILLSDPVSPWALMEGATAVYCVSSQLGFEAILTGHQPIVFGQPFYAGWGLSDDRMPIDRRQRSLTRAQLFAAAMILYPKWYDQNRDQLCTLEDALDHFEAETRAWRDDHAGWHATGMRLWKRGHLQRQFGQHKKMRFVSETKAIAGPPPRMVWANKATPALVEAGVTRVEDGFIRSRGLGAELTPPDSLVLDDLGIYYDPRSVSRLEDLINQSERLTASDLARAERLVEAITATRLSKYNLSGDTLPQDLPAGRRILVPGQVEDDASIKFGASLVKTNADLLKATREKNPAAVLLYKPHPDVEAGLRNGRVQAPEEWADVILKSTDPIAAIDACDEVWTMTSLLGFEALLRGKSVTCLGQPFYAHWGLTQDRAEPIARRMTRPGLYGLAHAVLIDYPRYFDARTSAPCSPEWAVEQLGTGTAARIGPANRILAKLQGVFASYAYLWR